VRNLRLLLAAAALPAAAACYPYWSGSALEDRIQALENASREQREQQDQLRRDFDARFAERLKAVDEAVEALSKSARKTTAEVGAQVDELQKQVQELRGLIEGNKFSLEDTGKRIDDLERRVAALGGEAAVEKLECKRALDELKRPADKSAFFALAKSYHDKKQYCFSRALFAEYVAKWKFDERAPEAQMLIGDSYFDEKDYRTAIVEYGKVREGWPKAKQLPDALYKLGLSFDALGARDEAKLFLEEAAKFTGQDAGKKARVKLQELNAKGGKAGGRPPAKKR
jgi:TolA-binding protein